jgi:polyhydroxyalkanoate synthesis repressor PhaR
MTGTRIVKRYANRKLYDTEEKRYVTLDQVAVLIREGAEIKVVDNESQEDLTSVTLSQILVEQEKKREGGLPKNFLTELVKSSSTVFDYLRKTLTSWLQAANISEEAIERNIDDLVKKGQLTLDEGARLKRDVVERTREYLGRIDETIEKRVTEVLNRLSIPTKSDLDQMRERMASLAKRYEQALEELRARLAPAEPAQSGDGTRAGDGAKPAGDGAKASDGAKPVAPQPQPQSGAKP